MKSKLQNMLLPIIILLCFFVKECNKYNFPFVYDNIYEADIFLKFLLLPLLAIYGFYIYKIKSKSPIIILLGAGLFLVISFLQFNVVLTSMNIYFSNDTNTKVSFMVENKHKNEDSLECYVRGYSSEIEKIITLTDIPETFYSEVRKGDIISLKMKKGYLKGKFIKKDKMMNEIFINKKQYQESNDKIIDNKPEESSKENLKKIFQDNPLEGIKNLIAILFIMSLSFFGPYYIIACYIFFIAWNNLNSKFKEKEDIEKSEFVDPHSFKLQLCVLTVSSIMVSTALGFEFVLVGVFAFIDSWKSGITKRVNKVLKGKIHLSPMEWGILIQSATLIFFPLYLFQRNKLKTKNKGSLFFILTIIVGISIIISKIIVNFEKIINLEHPNLFY